MKLRAKSRLMLAIGYYAVSGGIYLLLSLLSPALWFFSVGLAMVALGASYGLYSRRGWARLLSGLSSVLGTVFWGTSLYVSVRMIGNPFVENAPASADIVLAIDLALAVLVLLSAISLFHAYMERGSFSAQD